MPRPVRRRQDPRLAAWRFRRLRRPRSDRPSPEAGRHCPEAAAKRRASRTHDNGNIQPASDRNIGARQPWRLFQFENLSGLRDVSAPGKQFHSAKMRIAVGAGHGKDHASLETQAEREGLHLYRGGIFIIADENVADADRKRIHRTACRYADIAIAGAAKVLHRVERTAFKISIIARSSPAGTAPYLQAPSWRVSMRRGRTSQVPRSRWNSSHSDL